MIHRVDCMRHRRLYGRISCPKKRVKLPKAQAAHRPSRAFNHSSVLSPYFLPELSMFFTHSRIRITQLLNYTVKISWVCFHTDCFLSGGYGWKGVPAFSCERGDLRHQVDGKHSRCSCQVCMCATWSGILNLIK